MIRYTITVLRKDGTSITDELAKHDAIDGNRVQGKAIGDLAGLTADEAATCLGQIIDMGHDWGTDEDRGQELHAQLTEWFRRDDLSAWHFQVPDGWYVICQPYDLPDLEPELDETPITITIPAYIFNSLDSLRTTYLTDSDDEDGPEAGWEADIKIILDAFPSNPSLVGYPVVGISKDVLLAEWDEWREHGGMAEADLIRLRDAIAGADVTTMYGIAGEVASKVHNVLDSTGESFTYTALEAARTFLICSRCHGLNEKGWCVNDACEAYHEQARHQD